jgi:hypothetical protein
MASLLGCAVLIYLAAKYGEQIDARKFSGEVQDLGAGQRH